EHPAAGVRWSDAVAFCEWLSRTSPHEGQYYRLPTEAEWEYSCRAGATTSYYWGNEAHSSIEYAWTSENADGKTHPVGKLKPNAWGLYDMLGNVEEWTADCFDKDYYQISPRQDPFRGGAGKLRVLRGGSFSYPSSICNAAFREGANHRSSDTGFRV